MKKNNNINIDEQLKILKNVLSLAVEGKIDISGHSLILDDIKKCYDWFSQSKGVKSSILKSDIENLSAKCSELEVKKNSLISEIGDVDTEETLECNKAKLEQEINVCNADIENLKQQKNTLTTEINSLIKDKNTLVAEIGDVDIDDTLKYNKAELEQEIEELDSKKQTIQTEFNTFKESKKNEKDSLISKYNEDLKTHKEEINKQIKDYNEEFAKRKAEINKETKIIESFHHFIAETNKNMKIYFWSALGIILIAGLVLGFGLYNFCEAFSIYSKNLDIADKDGIKTINSVGSMLANAGSLFILKLPLSLVLITFIAGFYKLLKSMLITYEKINKDKRNASAVYAIMNTLNEESVAIVRGEEIDWTSQESIDRIREKIKWDKVSEYFSSLQKEQDASTEKDNNQNTITMSVFMDKVIALVKEFKK